MQIERAEEIIANAFEESIDSNSESEELMSVDADSEMENSNTINE